MGGLWHLIHSKGVKLPGATANCSALEPFWLLDLAVLPLQVHAAILAINDAVERGVVEDTLVALQNPNALLGNLREPLAAVYQELLALAKMEKAANARNHVRSSLGL